MKPCVEPIIVAQKPYAGKPVDSITATGAGALWIEGGRIGCTDVNEGIPYLYTGDNGQSMGRASERLRTNGNGARSSSGRWPANFALCHAEGCDGSCVEGCPVAALDEQAGERKSGAMNGIYQNTIMANRPGQRDGKPIKLCQEASSGGASRFYYVADWSAEIAERLDAANPVRYVPKAGRKERDAGLGGSRSSHPTIKAISLCRWLATLLLPPPEYAPRRILIPFAGSGSECIGAMLAGWEQVVGIELSEEYCEIGKARLAYWRAQMQPLLLEAEG